MSHDLLWVVHEVVVIPSRRSVHFFALGLSLLLIPILITCSAAQGLQTSPYSAANEVRRRLSPDGLDPAPSNPLGLPGSSFLGPRGSDTIPISSGLFQGLLPRIPNLELGYIYSFGPDVRAGRGTVDYLLPINLGNDSTIFGEVHAEFQSFWQARSGGTDNRVDLSFGGGYRTILRDTTLVGLNGFYDTSRLFGSWYSSGGLGLEMAAITPGDGAIDLNVNWYGNLFTRDGLINAFRNKGGSYDIEAGYSHPLFNQALDLRFKLTGYQFDIGNNVYGWRTGADLTTRDGVFTVKYESGRDRVNGSYNSIGGFVNVGFQPENILQGENPFISPEPVFQSPRNLRRMLTQKGKRDWHQPISAVTARTTTGVGPGRLPFTRTALVGIKTQNFGPPTQYPLSAQVTAANLAGVNRITVSWSGPADVSGLVPNNIWLRLSQPGCQGATQNFGGTVGSAFDVVNPAFWNLVCGPWDTLDISLGVAAGPFNFGTMTLTFWP